MIGKIKGFRLVVGLGNPGSRYTKTYHNVGFLFVKELGKKAEWIEEGALFSHASLDWEHEKVHLLLPQTFMNLSGEAVMTALRKYKIKPEEILVVHDDSDLALGSHKLSIGQRSAGHRGVQSIIDTLKTKEFYRLRIGIRTKPGKASDFVLRKISPTDFEVLQKLFTELKETVIEKE
ncbi:MAG: aminoacyl-tRNA hydrolase [Anaplasmataceae bacterium]|nr:aminoacyl-tRNA hydrolase [Anaplasmataceae bacterium]